MACMQYDKAYTLSRRLITDIMRGCRKASRTEVPRKLSIMACSRAAMKLLLLLLLLVSQPPRSSLTTRVTRHWWEGRPPSRYSGCRGDSVQPADITCYRRSVQLLPKGVLTLGLLLLSLLGCCCCYEALLLCFVETTAVVAVIVVGVAIAAAAAVAWQQVGCMFSL